MEAGNLNIKEVYEYENLKNNKSKGENYEVDTSAICFKFSHHWVWGKIFFFDFKVFDFRRAPRTMAATLKPYLTAVRHTLTAAMCLDNFSSQVCWIKRFFHRPVTNRSPIAVILINNGRFNFILGDREAQQAGNRSEVIERADPEPGHHFAQWKRTSVDRDVCQQCPRQYFN